MYDPNHIYLFPPSTNEWLPKEHLVYFISDLVDTLDLTTIYREYEKKGTRGQPPFHPGLMTKIIFYAYSRGVFSSRKIATRLFEDVAFIVLAGGNKPDFWTINEFRQRHIKNLPNIFVQILNLCEKAGLVGLKHVSLDGTKINANASKHKAISYDRMKTEEQKLEKEIKKLPEKANHLDLKEDKQFCHYRRGDEIPEELAYRETRLAKIKEAKAALEAEAKLAQKEDEKDSKDNDVPPTPQPPKGRVKYKKKTGERIKHNQKPKPAPKGRIPVDLPLPDLMRRKLRTKAGQSKYALRKQTVEPVFGQIKEARGFQRFLLRGLELVRGKWLLLCLTHNILKMFGKKNIVLAVMG